MKQQPIQNTATALIDKPNQPVGLNPNGIKFNRLKQRSGKIKYGCLAWMIGLPLPIVIILLFYKGCDF